MFDAMLSALLRSSSACIFCFVNARRPRRHRRRVTAHATLCSGYASERCAVSCRVAARLIVAGTFLQAAF